MEEEYKICIETYEISNFGNLRRKLKTGEYKTINGVINKDGYKTFQIQRDNKRFNYKFHCLIAKVFLGERPNNLVIDHIDRNKLNNNINNLRYITHKENIHNSDKYKSHILEEGQERISKVKKEYYENNKDQKKAYSKEYYENNKNHYKEYHKEYYKNNKEYIKEREKQYKNDNKELIKERSKEYYKNNKKMENLNQNLKI